MLANKLSVAAAVLAAENSIEVSVIAKIKHSLFMVLSFLCAYSDWLGEQKPKSQRA